jgi:hypothetical protein
VLSGFFPEMLNVPAGGYGNTCEICCTADMIYLALRQGNSGESRKAMEEHLKFEENVLLASLKGHKKIKIKKSNTSKS